MCVIYQGSSVAKDLKASLAILPVHSEVDKNGKASGGFVEVVKAINDIYSQGNISIKLYPFARSLKNVETGKADFHLPLIKRQNIPLDTLPFAYATECMTQVSFVLYTRADSSPINKSKLSQYNVETLRGHQQFFLFNIMEASTLEQGIKKLLSGRTDGFIMEQEAVDNYIRQNEIKNIRRVLYGQWDSCIVIPKGPKQKEIDKIISTSLRELKKSGRLQKITQKIHQPYSDWQPFLMNW